jgi:hypothetical protein
MEVETIGVARSLGWKVHMRCNNGYRQETRSMRRCVYRKQLDLETLVATRGPNFPLSRLESSGSNLMLGTQNSSAGPFAAVRKRRVQIRGGEW